MTTNGGEWGTRSRRDFVIGAGLFAASAVKTGRVFANDANLPPNIPTWSKESGAALIDPAYGRPMPDMAHVMRRELDGGPAQRDTTVSSTPLHEINGAITPTGLCFVRNHAGVPAIDVNDHRLVVHGLVDTALGFSVADIKRFPMVDRIHFLECAGNSFTEWDGPQGKGCQATHGLIHNVMYTGVPLRLVLQEAGLKSTAKWILAEGADSAAMARSIPIEKALDDCLIAYAMNGEALYPELGAPLRLVAPGWQGNMSVKWLRRIKVGDQPWNLREETAKYTDLLPSGKARSNAFVMDAKSVITRPSPDAPMIARGHNMLSGLAWSGRGRIKRVDVSLDGGRNWFAAPVAGPLSPKAWACFTAAFDWQGREMIILSRAMDETGYVQPTMQQLHALRGMHSFYHNNAIQAWRIRKSGEVENI